MSRHTVKVKICIAEDCKRDAKYSSGLCKMHYLRFKRYGRLHTIVNRGSGYSITSKGYVMITVNGKSKLEHIHKAELALGRKLPEGAQVHHLDNIPWNNENSNLVICPDREYHALLHKRAKELGYENY